MSILDLDLQSIQEARNLIKQAKSAQEIYAKFSQDKIDEIIKHISISAAQYSEELAKLAHEETGFGKWQDKVIKNNFAAITVFENIKNIKTVGIIHDDKINRVMDIGVPLGIITALVPSTNPTSTIIYKALIALKAGNAIIFSPHPNARRCSQRAIEIIQRAAQEAGAPDGIISGLNQLTLEATKALMHSKDVALILATGGEGMVRAAYSSGTPTISGGPGNGPAFIERSANIAQAVNDIIASKTFDNGVICASEQSIVVEKCIYPEVQRELLAQGAYFMNDEESARIASILLRPNGMINPETVGKDAVYLSKCAGLTVPPETRVLISLQNTVSHKNPYSREKLCPILGLYIEQDWHSACARVFELLNNEGLGHTLVIHSQNEDVIREFALQKPVHRVLINTPAALGAIGATTNLPPALTLGCGAIGGGSSSDNVGPMNLLNIRKVGYGVRTFEELCQSAPSSVSIPDPHSSIVEDSRFTAAHTSCKANKPAQPVAQDDRFTVASAHAGSSEINEENVERVIKEVLGKFSR